MLKKIITKANKVHAAFALLCVAIVAIGVGLAVTWYQYQLNADAVSYFSIAEYYAHGELRQAINGYWGPLLSWLLVPFVWLGINLVVAAKIIGVCTCIALLTVMYASLLRHGVKRYVVLLLCAAVSPIVLTWALIGPITPDLLFATLLVALVTVLDAFMALPSKKYAVLVGVLGALLYFTKGVGLYVFLGLIGIIALWQWRVHQSSWQPLLSRFALPLGVFLVLVVPFIALLTLKYDNPTITTGGAYNYAVVGPNLQWHQALAIDMFAPPHEAAVSAWEDPSSITSLLPGWKVFDSWDTFDYFVTQIVLRNFETLITTTADFDPLMSTGILVAFLGAVGTFVWRRQARLYVVTIAMLIAGYMLIALETRYIWAIWLFGALSVGLFVQTLLMHKILLRRHVLVVGAAAIILSTLSAMYQFMDTAYVDRNTYNASVALTRTIPQQSRILSDNFNFAISACYYAHLQCYGTIKSPQKQEFEAYYARLKDSGVTYAVSYNKESAGLMGMQEFLSVYFEQVSATNTEVVYKIKEP